MPLVVVRDRLTSNRIPLLKCKLELLEIPQDIPKNIQKTSQSHLSYALPSRKVRAQRSRHSKKGRKLSPEQAGESL